MIYIYLTEMTMQIIREMTRDSNVVERGKSVLLGVPLK